MEVKRTSPPPIDLLKSGVQVQKKNGVITDIMFLAGNE